MPLGVAGHTGRAVAAASAAAVATALLARTVRLAFLLAVTVGTELAGLAATAGAAAAVRAALLPGAVRLALLLLAVAVVAGLAGLATATGAAAAVGAALLPGAIGLAAADLHALALLAALPRRAGPAGAAATVAAALLAVAVRHALTTGAAVEFLYLGHTGVVPLHLAAEPILVAHAILDGGVVASRLRVDLAAGPGLGALTAILGTELAGLTALALAVSAHRARPPAASAAQAVHQVHAYPVPFHFAAEGVPQADTVLDRDVVAAGRGVGLAAACAATGTAVLGAGQAVLFPLTDPVATAAPGATAAAEILHLGDAHVVPRLLATEQVQLAHAGLDARIVASRPLLGLAAGAARTTGTAVLRAVAAGFAGDAGAVPAIGRAHTLSAAQGFHLRGTGVIPLG